MTDRTDKSSPEPPPSARISTLPPAVISLQRALLLSGDYNWRMDIDDVRCVEAFWELLSLDSTSHGFVLRLHDGSRRYLEYVMAPEGEGMSEDVDMEPMRDEQSPVLEGGGIEWSDNVDALNDFLGGAAAGGALQ